MFAAAQSAVPIVRTLVLLMLWMRCIDSPCRMETHVSQKTQGTVSMPVPGRPPVSTPPIPQTLPAEPSEVLGLHKNTGQKDHKGSR